MLATMPIPAPSKRLLAWTYVVALAVLALAAAIGGHMVDALLWGAAAALALIVYWPRL